jgi:hypothetical protein
VLPLEELDPRDVALDSTGAQRGRESGRDGREILAKAVRKGADLLHLGFVGLGEPFTEPVTVEAAEDGGEAADQAAGLGILRAATAHVFEVLAGLVVLVLWPSDDPPDDIGDRGWWRRDGSGAVVPGQGVKESSDALAAPEVAAGGDLVAQVCALSHPSTQRRAGYGLWGVSALVRLGRSRISDSAVATFAYRLTVLRSSPRRALTTAMVRPCWNRAWTSRCRSRILRS